MMENHADLIMITYNSERFLPSIFHFIKDKTNYPYHLIVIDNNSTDQSRAYLSRLKQKDSIKDRMTLILNPQNIGVSKAWNKAMDLCNGKYVVFLNPDLKLTRGWLEKMVSCAERHPKAAVVGAKILNYDGTINHAGFLKGVRGRGEKDGPGKYDTETEVHGIQGSCFLVKRSVFPVVGKFDERFFVYGEEDDFCLRARKAGFTVMYCPVPIYHFREGSAIPRKERINLRMTSWKKYKEKWR